MSVTTKEHLRLCAQRTASMLSAYAELTAGALEEVQNNVPALPGNDDKYYIIKNKEYVAVEVIATPEEFAPSIASGQSVTLTADADMTPYVVQAENAGDDGNGTGE